MMSHPALPSHGLGESVYALAGVAPDQTAVSCTGPRGTSRAAVSRDFDSTISRQFPSPPLENTGMQTQKHATWTMRYPVDLKRQDCPRFPSQLHKQTCSTVYSRPSATSLCPPVPRQLGAIAHRVAILDGAALPSSPTPAHTAAYHFQTVTASRSVRCCWQSTGAEESKTEAVQLKLEESPSINDIQPALGRQPPQSGTSRFASAVQKHIERMSRGRASATRSLREQGLAQGQTLSDKISAARNAGAGATLKLATGCGFRPRFFSRTGTSSTLTRDATSGNGEEAVLNPLGKIWSARKPLVQTPRQSAVEPGNSSGFSPTSGRPWRHRERQNFFAPEDDVSAPEKLVSPQRNHFPSSQRMAACQPFKLSSVEAHNGFSVSRGRRCSPRFVERSPVTSTRQRWETPTQRASREYPPGYTTRSTSVNRQLRDRSKARPQSSAEENLEAKKQLDETTVVRTKQGVATRTAFASGVWQRSWAVESSAIPRPQSASRVSRSSINGNRPSGTTTAERASDLRQSRSVSTFSTREKRNVVRCESRSAGVQEGQDSEVLRRPSSVVPRRHDGVSTIAYRSVDGENSGKIRIRASHATKETSRRSLRGRLRRGSAHTREAAAHENTLSDASPPRANCRCGRRSGREMSMFFSCQSPPSGSSTGMDKGGKTKADPTKKKLPPFRAGGNASSTSCARQGNREHRLEQPVLKASREKSSSRQRLAEQALERTASQSPKRGTDVEAVLTLSEAVAGSRRNKTSERDEEAVKKDTMGSWCKFGTKEENEKEQSGVAQKVIEARQCSMSASTEGDLYDSPEFTSEDEGNKYSELTKEDSLESRSGLGSSLPSVQTSVEERSSTALLPQEIRVEAFLTNLENLISVIRETDPVVRRAKVDRMHAQLIEQRGRSEKNQAGCCSVGVHSNGEYVKKSNSSSSYDIGNAALDSIETAQERRSANDSRSPSEASLSSRIKLAQLKADLRLHVDSLLAKVQIDTPLRDALTAGLSDETAGQASQALSKGDAHAIPHQRGNEKEAEELVADNDPVSADHQVDNMQSSNKDHVLEFSFMDSEHGYHSGLGSLVRGRFPLDTILEDEEGSPFRSQDAKDMTEDHPSVIANRMSC
ncbi:hypothetical protein TGMAS_320515 [Toxoplasma gondii MAS]|uniref:Uncharacterized protein n=1 Tax=Toxoplasma gondii MAS TaxID=943118 RepID=A0A086QEW3_TOXGO|nr:hypothetical protein TGMAS_320515 [Toxoplasma gondii MAS]